MEENRELEIDLRKIFSMLKKKIIYIVIIGLIGGAIAGCFTNFFIEPQYTANVKLYVNSNNDNLVSSNGSISSSEIDASQKLVNTYIVVVKSNTFLEKVSDELGGTISTGTIKSMISASQIDETLAFQVNVTNHDPQLAAQIANIIAETCPSEIVRVLKVGGVEIIDYAKVPTSPSSPNIKKNIMIGFLAALAVSFAFFFIKELFNTSISSEADLSREFNIPVLGTIPRLLPIEEKKPDNKGSTLEEIAEKAGKESK